MNMIDVMKRLAELDRKNPTIVKESQNVEECGMMPEMGIDAMARPSTPASINMTAGSGEELSDMLATIMQLAGVKQQGDEEPISTEPSVAISAEPEMDSNTDMRSVMDLLNPQDDGGGEEEPANISGLDRDHDGDHDIGDHELEKDDEEDADEGQYDNSPANPIKPPMFNANKYAHQENQPGQGDRMDGTSPKAYADMNEATADLFAQYKTFISEGTQEVGQLMANDGITYSPEREDEIINKMAEYMKKSGMDSKQIRYLLNQEDYIPDQLSYLPRVKNRGMMESKPSAGMSAKEKSSLAKKASAGKDIGKPGKSFDKVAAKAGGGEKGKKIAAAAMWKNAAKK